MRKNEKVIYEVDPFNRLVYTRAGKQSRVPKFRKVLEGEFKADSRNALSYRVKQPQGPAIPQQVRLSGQWSLNKNDDLVFTLDKENNQRSGDKLTLKGGLIDARDDELLFVLSTRKADGSRRSYMLRLGGAWQADKHNRLIFSAQRQKGAADELVLSGSWQVNKHNEIEYTYARASLKTKERLKSTVTFKGYWDITEKNRLLYALDKEIGSVFDFKVSVGMPAKRGLRYEIGIGAAPRKKTFTLFGSWKVDEKLGLMFEVPYEGGRRRAIMLGADCRLGPGYTVELRLKNASQKPLGMSLRLSKSIFKNQGEAFIEALRQGGGFSISAGAGFRF